MLRTVFIAVVVIVIFIDVVASAIIKENNINDAQWTKFKVKYQKMYGGETDLIRRGIWENNIRRIEAHNALYAKGLTTSYLGENQFADWTPLEFSKIINRHLKPPNPSRPSTYPTTPFNVSKKVNNNTHNPLLPSEVDWVTRGYVTGVKRQDACAAGWAFSATGAIEGAHYKATGRLVNLSEKNLMDCSWKYGNEGCAGGTADNAFTYVMRNKGMDTEQNYPYSPFNDVTCHFNVSGIGATIAGYKDIPSGTEMELQRATATVGPISVVVDADHFSFMVYKGGLYDEPGCSSTELSHAMLVVGYGTFGADKDFWLVKNSFGASWGDGGYIKMSRNKHNQCGIASAASYPEV